MSIGQFQQFFRHAPIDIKENEVFNHLVGGTQASAKHFQYLDGYLRVLHNGVMEITALQRIAFYFFQGNCVSRARQTIKDGEFAKTFSLTEDHQRHLLTVRANQANFDFSLFNDIQNLTGVVAMKYHLASTKRAAFRDAHQFTNILVIESIEKRNLFQVQQFLFCFHVAYSLHYYTCW